MALKCQQLLNIIVGVIANLCLFLVVTLSIPIYFYRFLISKLGLMFFKSAGKMVDFSSHIFAVDFLKPIHPPRNTIVVTTVFEGEISFTDFCKVVDVNCINARDSRGDLLYPELQQHIDSWMGFMFWKHDKSFSLKKHLFLHQLNDNGSSDKWVDDLVESLLNQPYPLKESPWELHLIQNAKLDYLSGKTKAQNFTVVVLKVHHAVGDLSSIQQLLVENLCEHPVQNLAIPSAQSTVKLTNLFPTILEYFHRVGWLFSRVINRPTNLLVPEYRQSGYQFYGKVPLISVDKIKTIKNRFNVSFYAVLNAAASAALSNFFEGKEEMSEKCSNMLFGNHVGRQGHPRQLTNYGDTIIVGIPLTSALSPVERLTKCDESIQLAKASLMRNSMKWIARISLSQLAPVVKLLLKNKQVASSFSNFAGSGKPFYFNKKNKAVDMSFVVGALNGQAGIMFGAYSHVDHIRIVLSAEKALCSRETVNLIVNSIVEEIDTLYQIANEEPSQM